MGEKANPKDCFGIGLDERKARHPRAGNDVLHSRYDHGQSEEERRLGHTWREETIREAVTFCNTEWIGLTFSGEKDADFTSGFEAK